MGSEMLRPVGAFGSFAVRDIPSAAAFYRDILGLQASEVMDGSLLDLSLPGRGGHLMVYAKPDHVPATFTVLTLEVGDLEATVDALIAAGLAMQRYEGMDQDDRGIARGMGPAIAWFLDPSENILAVMGAIDA